MNHKLSKYCSGLLVQTQLHIKPTELKMRPGGIGPARRNLFKQFLGFVKSLIVQIPASFRCDLVGIHVSTVT